MAIREELEAAIAEATRPCLAARQLAQLDEEARELVNRKWPDGTFVLSSRIVARILGNNGLRCCPDVIQRHRNGACMCQHQTR